MYNDSAKNFFFDSSAQLFFTVRFFFKDNADPAEATESRKGQGQLSSIIGTNILY